MSINWEPFSLAIKNDELTKDRSEHSQLHRDSLRVHRVIYAAHKQHGVATIDLYTAFGTQFHLFERDYDDALILDVLRDFKLPIQLLQAADKTTYDNVFRKYIQTATTLAGEDIGVPTLAFTRTDGSQVAYFGPVLEELPEEAEGLQIWDGLYSLATSSNFYELKRARPSGPPNVFSTAKC